MNTIQLTEKDNGQRITAAPGDTIEIQLDEVPATGYKWEIADNGNLKIESDNYELYDTAGVGGGGKKNLRFTVEAAGQGQLKLVNRQLWSSDVYKTFEISYDVK